MKPRLLAGEQHAGESKRAVIACNDYLRMGPGRSMAKLLERYLSATETPPSRRLKTLKDWSVAYGWQGRATWYDAETERQKTEYARHVMTSGLAQAHERVVRLKDMADLLEAEIMTRQNGQLVNVWLADVKTVGSGETAERVDLVRFNHQLIEQWRGVLDDLAKEIGHRRIKRDNLNIDFDKLTDDQLQRIAAGEDPLDVLLSNTGGGDA